MHNVPDNDAQSSSISANQANEMFYSIIWSTEDRDFSKNNSLDISSKEEIWLAKLGSWTAALAVYEEKLKNNPDDFEAITGCMQCLVANGDWRKVLELADENWLTMVGRGTMLEKESPKLQRKAVRMCAQAAWRLGQWGDLAKFSSHLVGGADPGGVNSPSFTSISSDPVGTVIDFEGAFYSAVLHVHRKEWANAANAIDAARRAMDGRLTALMAESYSSAYPSMVTAQTLAEMEEIVEFRKVEERSKVGSNRHPINRPNEDDAKDRLLSVWRERLAGCRVDAEVHSSILAVRSLVLGPTDEVEATLTLSELSRQSQRYKFAERVLLDPLESLGAEINGRTFGFGLSESLRLRVDFSVVASSTFPVIIERVLAGDLGSILPACGPKHDQWSKTLVKEAGGLDK
jgi:serine/threonine-protein kinase mTOR